MLSRGKLRGWARHVGSQRLRLLVVVTGGHFLVHWFMQLFPLILPSVKAALGLSDVQVGALSTARELATGAMNFPVGLMADGLARYRAFILVSAVVSMGLAFLLFGNASGFFLALLASGFMGFGVALWHPTAMASLSSRFPEHRATALAIHGMGATVSDTITPLLVGSLFVFYPWRGVLGFQFLVALCLAVPLAMGLKGIFTGAETPGNARAGHASRTLLDFVCNPSFMGMAAANGFMNAGRVLVITFFPLYIQEDLGYSALGLGFYYTLLHILGTVSQPILGLASDRFGRKAVLLPAFSLLAVLYTVIGFVPAGWPLGLVVTVISLFFYTLTNITAAAATDVAGARQASSLGLIFLLNNVLVLPAPVLGGFLGSALGIASVFALAGACLLLAALVIAPLNLYRGSRT